MKKIYVSLLLLIALFAFIFFVVDINFSGNVNNNTEVKKDLDGNFEFTLAPLSFALLQNGEHFE